MIIVDPVVEEDVVQVVDAANTPLLWEFAKLVSVRENLLVLLPPELSVKAVSCTWNSYIVHVSFNPVIQFPPTLIEDVHIQDPPVITKAITGPYSRVLVQGPLEERLEIFCAGALEEGLRRFIDSRAEPVQKA